MKTRTGRIAPLLAAAGVLVSALMLAGCTADPQPAPTAPAASSPGAADGPGATDAPGGTEAPGGTDAGPSASATPLAVPEPIDGEIGRAVFTAVGPDGVPETRTEILAVPEEGVAYTAEGMCVAAQPGARFGFELTTADPGDSGRALLSIDDVCSGIGLLSSSVELDASLIQVSITQTDGISSAWVRVVPTETLQR